MLNIYLKDGQKLRLVVNYAKSGSKDVMDLIDSTDKLAADNAVKVVVEYLEKEIEDAKMGRRLAKMYQCLEALKELALDKPPEKV